MPSCCAVSSSTRPRFNDRSAGGCGSWRFRPGPHPSIPLMAASRCGPRERQGTMSYGAPPRLGLHLRPTLALFLGLAAIIFGIIGMHILNVSHQASVPATSGHSTSAPAATAHAMHHAPTAERGTPSTDAAAAMLPADGCAGGPCAGDHHLMAVVCVLMTIVAGFVLLFVPKWLRTRNANGLRAPPKSAGPGAPALRPPSLIQLSISRT